MANNLPTVPKARQLFREKLSKTKGNPQLTSSALPGLGERVSQLERRLTVVEEQERSEPWHDGLVATLPSLEGSPGFLVDPGVARATPCTRIELGEGREVMFSKGIVGALDEEQKALYCPETITKPVSPKQQERIRAFQDAAQTCKGEIESVPKGERMRPWIECMSREARSRGVEL